MTLIHTARRLISDGMVQRYKNWVTSAGVFAALGGVTFLYMTDWKVVVTKIPFYNTKFQTEDEEPKK